MDDIAFTKPPAKRKLRYDWQEVAAKLKAKPGEWAWILDDATTYYTALKAGKMTAINPDDYEFRSENTHNEPTDNNRRHHTLYMRYVGKETP